MTALVVDSQGRLTYVGVDGVRRVIIGDAELLRRFLDLSQGEDDLFEGGCGI